MKSPLKISLSIIGGLLLIAVIAAFAMGAKVDFGTEARVEREYTAKGEVRDVVIDASSDDVAFTASPDGLVHITYYENSVSGYTISLTGGKLTVKHKPVIGTIFGGWKQYTLTVSLPEGAFGTVQATSASGDITSNLPLQAGEMRVSTASGSISLSGATIEGGLSLNSASGKLSASDIRCTALTAHTASGRISLGGIAAETLSADSASGKISIDDAQIGELTVDTASGGVTGGRLSLKRATVKTASGDIVLGLLEADAPQYKMTLSTSSGRVRVNGGGYDLKADGTASIGGGGNEIKLSSASGDLTVNFE